MLQPTTTKFRHHKNVEQLVFVTNEQQKLKSLYKSQSQCKDILGPVYTVRTKFQNFLRSYVEGVYTIQNGAYERNSLTAYSLGGHNIMLNWMTVITDL